MPPFSPTPAIAPGPRVEAVLFDYGLVLTGPAHPLAWERMKSLLEADEASFHAAYWRYRQAYDSGALTGEVYWRTIVADLGRPQNVPLQNLIDADTDLWTEPNAPMIDWARSLQVAGIRTGILSNLGDAMEEGVRRRCPWLEDFAHLTFSHRLGITKPAPAIYRHAAEGLGLVPAKILFIDDREDNIAGALAAGMPAIRYLDHDSFLEAMRMAGFAYLLTPEKPAF